MTNVTPIVNFTYKNKVEGCLSNMSSHPVKWNGIDFSMGEAAFHYAKYYIIAQDSSRKKELLVHADKFLLPCTGPQYKSLGGKSKNGLALTPQELTIWSASCDKVQQEICKYKYQTYKDIQTVLAKTTGVLLIHSCRTADDKMAGEHWCGRYKDNVILGGNMLGKIWMNIRDNV